MKELPSSLFEDLRSFRVHERVFLRDVVLCLLE